MTLIQIDKQCPKCGLRGWYEETRGRRGRGLGVPVEEWVMAVCGHAFSTPEYERFGAGWAWIPPGSRGAQPCE